jgi:hypothetical protein
LTGRPIRTQCKAAYGSKQRHEKDRDPESDGRLEEFYIDSERLQADKAAEEVVLEERLELRSRVTFLV